MAIDSQNCKDTLLGYLSDIPSLWRDQVATALCAIFVDKYSLGCEVIQTCETITSLSNVTVNSEDVCMTFTDENGISHERCFTYNDIFNYTLSQIDPKCIATQGIWDSWTFKQKVQAIIYYSCNCTKYENFSTTTTTTAP